MTDVDPLAVALHAMAGVFGDGMTAMHVGGLFTCSEAETIADVLIESGHVEAARTWLRHHADGDDGGDMHGVCRHCDALLLLPDSEDATEVCVDALGSAWCSPDRATEHEPTSWTLAGKEG